MRTTLRLFTLTLTFTLALPALAQTSKDDLIKLLDSRTDTYAGVARQIWTFAELGYQEKRSSALLQEQFKAAGFKVEAGVAGMPTAFIASYGTGGPVIG